LIEGLLFALRTFLSNDSLFPFFFLFLPGRPKSLSLDKDIGVSRSLHTSGNVFATRLQTLTLCFPPFNWKGGSENGSIVSSRGRFMISSMSLPFPADQFILLFVGLLSFLSWIHFAAFPPPLRMPLLYRMLFSVPSPPQQFEPSFYLPLFRFMFFSSFSEFPRKECSVRGKVCALNNLCLSLFLEGGLCSYIQTPPLDFSPLSFTSFT